MYGNVYITIVVEIWFSEVYSLGVEKNTQKKEKENGKTSLQIKMVQWLSR